MKFYIKTFGCQANEADSQKIVGFFENQGYEKVLDPQKADLVIFNTCSVRESAENRVFGQINNFRKIKKNNKPKIILTGCMVGSAVGERKRYKLSGLRKKLPNVDEFKTISDLIGHSNFLSKQIDNKDTALVPIMEGCDHFCTYCVVPYARGAEISRDFDEIIDEIKDLTKRGYKEIMLLGQNVNSYGKNLQNKKDFADLLEEINKIEGLQLIKFMTSNPWDLSDKLIKAMKLSKVSKTLHLPVQSGDNEILKKMNRSYTAEEYLNLVEKIKDEIPEMKFTTDIIVGFPGETEEQFNRTLDLCGRVEFDLAYISKYSPRPGTAAEKFTDDVLPKEKKRRWQILNTLINQ